MSSRFCCFVHSKHHAHKQKKPQNHVINHLPYTFHVTQILQFSLFHLHRPLVNLHRPHPSHHHIYRTPHLAPQIKYRLGLNVTTHKLHLSFHDVRDHSRVHRQTHDKPLHPHHQHLHFYTHLLHSPPYRHQNAPEHLHRHPGNTNDAVKN